MPGGILVEIQPGAEQTSIVAAGTLASALRDERISVTGPIKSSPAMAAAGQIKIDPDAKIRIVVGKKP